jgi:hypothetical protein
MGKRDDKNYTIVAGNINKTLAYRFKNHCLKKGIEQSTALEMLLRKWLDRKAAK